MIVYDVKLHDKEFWINISTIKDISFYDQELDLFINKDYKYVKLNVNEIKNSRYWVFSGNISKDTIFKSNDLFIVNRRRFFIGHLIRAEIKHLFR